MKKSNTKNNANPVNEVSVLIRDFLQNNGVRLKKNIADELSASLLKEPSYQHALACVKKTGKPSCEKSGVVIEIWVDGVNEPLHFVAPDVTKAQAKEVKRLLEDRLEVLDEADWIVCIRGDESHPDFDKSFQLLNNGKDSVCDALVRYAKSIGLLYPSYLD